MDTGTCPNFDSANSCTYQFFDKGYAIFSYKVPMNGATNFAVRLAYYTKWAALGGINGPGRPVDAEVAVTASTGNTSTFQAYSNGAIYTISSGVYSGKTFAVVGPIYTRYLAQGGQASALGLPTADEITLSSGVHHQTFQNGVIDYTPGSGDPTLKVAVKSVALAGVPPGGSVKLNYGDSFTLTASAVSSFGGTLPDRVFTWTSTNGQVVNIQPAGPVAVIKAIGGGLAYVSVSCEGVTSTRVNVVVTAPCCKVGEGAPATVQQNFQDAVARNSLSAAYPSPNAVTRSGNGYVQTVQSQGGSFYLLAKSDKSGSAFVVMGDLL
jgi:hypothetical protein